MQVQLNGEPHEFTTVPPTLANLIASLGFTGKRIAVERNGDIVPKSQYQVTQLNEHDRLEVIVAVGGG
ncbi:MAG: sulfur carrier protein ThiS [Pseudomonadota bacterium]